MAKYEREFLVPYLRDVCALNLALHKLEKRLHTLACRKKRLEKGVYDGVAPKEPFYDTSFGGIFLVVFGVITLLMSFVMFGMKFSGFGWFFLLGGGMELAIGAVKLNAVVQANAEKREIYFSQLESYTEIKRKNDKERKAIPGIVNEMRRCQSEIERTKDTLRKVYSINVIPGHYRNIYAAVFLYDWFSTGKSNDLDMALNMFVLEEIKEKLDTIIENQQEIILNQCIQLSEQRKAMELQEAHSVLMQEKLNQIDASNEERNTYLEMIESNTAVSAYFAAADYIMRI